VCHCRIEHTPLGLSKRYSVIRRRATWRGARMAQADLRSEPRASRTRAAYRAYVGKTVRARRACRAHAVNDVP